MESVSQRQNSAREISGTVDGARSGQNAANAGVLENPAAGES